MKIFFVVFFLLVLTLQWVWQRRTFAKLEQITMNQAQLAEALVSVNTTLKHIGEETGQLLAKIDSLQTELQAAGQVSPEVQAALADLVAQAKKVDDLVPDAIETPAAPVAEQPAAETPADTAPAADAGGDVAPAEGGDAAADQAA